MLGKFLEPSGFDFMIYCHTQVKSLVWRHIPEPQGVVKIKTNETNYIGKTVYRQEIQHTIRDHKKQLYVNKMANLEEVDKFLKKYNLKLHQEEIKNLNRFITSTESETINNLPTNKKSRTRWLHR